VFGVSESWVVWIDGLVERDIEDAEERELEVPKRDCLPSKVDGPGPSLPCIIPAAAAVAVAAASCFFFSSASFRWCSSWSNNDRRIASMSINFTRD
jgi:hypothetical protein